MQTSGPRTYGHARAKERPVWLLFVAHGLKDFFFFFLHVRPRTYGHVLVIIIVGCQTQLLSVCQTVTSRLPECLLTIICNEYPLFASMRSMKKDVRTHDIIMQRCLQ